MKQDILQEGGDNIFRKLLQFLPHFPHSDARYLSVLSSALPLALTIGFVCCKYSSLLTTTGALYPWQDQELWSHTYKWCDECQYVKDSKVKLAPELHCTLLTSEHRSL